MRAGVQSPSAGRAKILYGAAITLVTIFVVGYEGRQNGGVFS